MASPSTTITADHMASALAAEACQELHSAFAKIQHCVNQLTDQQVWWRASEPQNSIGNLMLHLCGNVRQWIVSGISGADDVRDRPREFSERGPMPKEELLARLQEVVAEAVATLSKLTATESLRVRCIQGFDVTCLAAVFHTLPHFRGHTQEIVHMTRSLLGDAYRFSWKPQTPEQGASA